MLFNGVDDLAVGFAGTACPDAGCALEVQDFEGVLDAMIRLGVIDKGIAGRLRTADSSEAALAAQAVLRFRGTVIEALEALRTGAALPPHVLNAINARLGECGCRREVVHDGAGYHTRVVFEIEKPMDLLMPLANAIAQTLTSVDPTRVKKCREPRCACYFIDTSKNRTRTWCSMQRCGNRAKVAAYYTRSKNVKHLRA